MRTPTCTICGRSYADKPGDDCTTLHSILGPEVLSAPNLAREVAEWRADYAERVAAQTGEGKA